MKEREWMNSALTEISKAQWVSDAWRKNPELDFKSSLKHAVFSFPVQHREDTEIQKIMKQNRNATPPYSLYSISCQTKKTQKWDVKMQLK